MLGVSHGLWTQLLINIMLPNNIFKKYHIW
jgi:hypothetical protein